jgi:hypothetical protein
LTDIGAASMNMTQFARRCRRQCRQPKWSEAQPELGQFRCTRIPFGPEPRCSVANVDHQAVKPLHDPLRGEAA